MPRRAIAWALFLGICLAALPAWAETRVALVIGNSDYALISPLANPANDAALMAETLRAVGFEVIETKNADQRAMKRAISDFGRRLEAAGKDGVGLFYYAGHAVEARGVNYLIPLDAPIERAGDLDIEAVSAQWVLTQMEIAGNGLNVVILDSCRNNPFKGSFRAATRGLARMRAPTGSYIAYAAAPGELASDGDGSNSPYTAALAAAIQEPGLKLEDVFKRVRARVHGQSGGKQTPWEEGSVIGDFYFVPPGSTVTVTPPGVPPAFDARALELALWETVKDSADPADFEDYLAQYPSGVFSGSAKRRLAARLSERKPAEDRVAVGIYPKAGHRPGETFKDCPGCPEMVVIPPGRFRMGDLSGGGEDNEKPVHAVTIDYKFAVGRFEVTRGEFAAFVKDTGYGANGGCWYYTGSDWEESGSKSWRRPGFSQSDRDPVVCVNWDDAQAYLRWLGRKTGVAYRLLSEAEWEYTARAGGTSKYPSGDAENSLCVYGNGADRSTDFHWRNKSCGDGYGERTAPVGSYRPNAFGVFDTAGNVWEWTQDCWHGSYHGATGDGGAWTTAGDCAKRVLRGGSWFNRPWNLRSAIRGWHSTVTRYLYYGFRVARTLDR